MFKMRHLFIYSCILTVTLAVPALYKDCGSQTGHITSIDISPCSRQPCPLRHNTNVSLAVKFTPNIDTANATTFVYGDIIGIDVPFPLPNNNACSNMACPLVKGREVTYTNQLQVLSIYPKIRVVVKWEVKDQTGKNLFCFVLPAEITD